MPLIRAGITATRPAREIIGDIRILLTRRHRWQITRSGFLKEYSKLRYELESTQEYQEFHYAVVQRSRGQCERKDCKRQAAHVHHRKRLAMYPELAVDPDNGEHVCRQCHQKSHPRAKI